ncbi:5-oxopent-3-ene-1,2,5-tricarboxylate decarboxylase/2-hydroxyhepta-2,4-diene-1,7-dioate isomerase [Variovorax paradoxus]|uniref:fumarylacetoacetate hydrolase family protein n=1 Tax=Variovorax TaxID=34072 RepID=UPI00119C0881|nr:MULTISPECIES: fumarylacetoacetate hydrolase family protein [Variovorax]MDR6522143.1 5-oxopent-3-ene-1,2,5-tricarboxylate decarboxylase/2-hydroxyhepta-2,4-diene-1,7-dioate isomerase [Variovorax paradoxus]
MNPHDYHFNYAPYQLTGTVYGTLLNDRHALAALGDSIHELPYKGAPKAPVLYVKPRNTFQPSGARVITSQATHEWEVGGSLALVIGRTACRVSVDDAFEYVAGYTVVADLSVPHESFYRPSIRFKARDGSLIVADEVVAQQTVTDPGALTLRTYLDDQLVQESSLNNMVRPAAQLLADVTDFMTLSPGDLLLLGVPHGAPRARKGQQASVEIRGVATVHASFVGEDQ